MGLGSNDLAIYFQIGAIIDEMKKFVAHLVRMEAGAHSRIHMGQVHRAGLIAHNDMNVAPGADRTKGFCAGPGIVDLIYNGILLEF